MVSCLSIDLSKLITYEFSLHQKVEIFQMWKRCALCGFDPELIFFRACLVFELAQVKEIGRTEGGRPPVSPLLFCFVVVGFPFFPLLF